MRTADLTPPVGPAVGPPGRSGRPSAVNPPVRTSPRFEDIVSEDSTEFEEPDRPHRRPWLLIGIVGLGIGLGAILGVLMVAGLGPFGSDRSPTFVFDEARYDDVALPLTPTSVGASSVLPGDAVTSFGPSMLVDGDRRSAWRSLPEVDEPVILDLTFEEPVWVLEIAVATGDQSGADAFGAVGRPTELLVTFDGTRAVRIALQAVPGVQTVPLDLPRLTGEVRFELAPDTIVGEGGAAISEITVTGFEADDADAAAWREAYG